MPRARYEPKNNLCGRFEEGPLEGVRPLFLGPLMILAWVGVNLPKMG